MGLVALGLALTAAVPEKASAQVVAARTGRKRVLVKIDRSRRERSIVELTRGMRRHNPRVLRSYRVAPFISMEIDENSISELSTQASVLAVYDDVLVAPSLAQSVPTTEAPAIWSRGYTGGGKAVAVLDTGVDTSHPFLSGRVISEACYSTAAGGSVSMCPNGRSEQVGQGAAAPCAFGGCFHGTHVAGIVAGNGTPTGRSAWGVAKGADIIAINVFTRFNDAETCGAGNAPCALSYMSDMIAGLERVYELRFTHDIAAVNMSLGGGAYAGRCDDAPIKTIIDQLRASGVATIVASGNEGNVNGMGFPACVSSAISVGAVNNTGVVASFSNVSRYTTLFAPGVNILSSVPGGYARSSGTSMAAPHVAGAWALMSEALPGASVDRILGAIVSTGVATRDSRAGGSFTKPNLKIERALETLMPRLVSVSPSVMAIGERGIVTVTGSGFVAGMDVDFGSAITVHSVTVSSATTMVLDISVAAGAQLGTHELTVSTPDGASARGLALSLQQNGSTNLRAAINSLPAELGSSRQFELVYGIVNMGGGAAPATNAAVYLSRDAALDSTDTLVERWSIAALEGGATTTATRRPIMPANAPTGEMYLLLVADDARGLTESDETDNVRSQRVVVGADLRASLSSPSAVRRGSVVRMFSSVTNAGGGAASAAKLTYYLSTDEVLDASDRVVGSSLSRAIAPKSSVSVRSYVRVPRDVTSGRYHLIAVADASNVVAETVESNNAAVRMLTVR